MDPGQQAPRIAAGDVGFVVVWQAWAEDGDGWGVYGRSFAVDGTAESGDIALNQRWQDDQVSPAVAVDGSGSFVAVWEDHSTGEWSTILRRFDSSGGSLSDESGVGRTNPSAGRLPQIAMSPDGRFFVASWDGSILAQRFLPDGTPIGLAPW